MLLRIFVIAVALLFIAAPADAAETVDAQAELCCEESPAAVALPAASPARVAIVATDDTLPPAPALGEIFRPPRASFA